MDTFNWNNITNKSLGVKSLEINWGGTNESTAELKERLTPREREIFNLVIRGASNIEIVSSLNITIGNVKTHMRNIFEKLDISRREELITKSQNRIVTKKEVEDFRVTKDVLLTDTEIEIIVAICNGMSNIEIAGERYIEQATVKSHINNIFAKLNIRSRSKLMVSLGQFCIDCDKQKLPRLEETKSPTEPEIKTPEQKLFRNLDNVRTIYL